MSGVSALPGEPDGSLEIVGPAFIQRRLYARWHAPVGMPFMAEFTLGGRLRVLSVDNIALGGIGLRASPTQAALLYVGRRLPRVWVEFGPGRGFMTELEIRSRRLLQTFLLGEQYVVGCRFTGLSAPAEAIVEHALAELELHQGVPAAPTATFENQ